MTTAPPHHRTPSPLHVFCFDLSFPSSLSAQRLKLVGRASGSARLVLLASASPNAASLLSTDDRGMGAAGKSFHSSLSLFISVRCAASLSLPRYVVAGRSVGSWERAPISKQQSVNAAAAVAQRKERERDERPAQPAARAAAPLPLPLSPPPCRSACAPPRTHLGCCMPAPTDWL